MARTDSSSRLAIPPGDAGATRQGLAADGNQRSATPGRESEAMKEDKDGLNSKGV